MSQRIGKNYLLVMSHYEYITKFIPHKEEKNLHYIGDCSISSSVVILQYNF